MFPQSGPQVSQVVDGFLLYLLVVSDRDKQLRVALIDLKTDRENLFAWTGHAERGYGVEGSAERVVGVEVSGEADARGKA